MRTGSLACWVVATLGLNLGLEAARAGGPPCATCAHGGASGLLGHPPTWEDESPLYPQLAWWTFQKAQCKQPLPCKGSWFHGHKGSGGVVAFPPLPYSPLAGRTYPPGMTHDAPPPSAAPAAAPSAPTTPPVPAAPDAGAGAGAPPAEGASPRESRPRPAAPPSRPASPFDLPGGPPPPPTGFPID